MAVIQRARLAIVAAAVLSVSNPARAQGSAKSGAEALYDEAWNAMEKRDYDTACAKFEAAFKVANATGPLQGLARCEEARHRPAHALELWREALRRLPTNSSSVAAVREAISQLEPKVGRLSLRPGAEAVPGTEVRLDGDSIGVDGAEHVVEPDVDHQLRVSAPQHKDRVDTIRLRGGEARTIQIAPGPALIAHPDASSRQPTTIPTTPPEHGGSPALRTWGLVVGGVGLAGAAAAAVTGVMMLSAQSDVDKACGASRDACANPDAASVARDRGKTLAPINGVAFGVAAAGRIMGTTLFVVGSGGTEKRSAAVGVHAGQVTIDGRF